MSRSAVRGRFAHSPCPRRACRHAGACPTRQLPPQTAPNVRLVGTMPAAMCPFPRKMGASPSGKLELPTRMHGALIPRSGRERGKPRWLTGARRHHASLEQLNFGRTTLLCWTLLARTRSRCVFAGGLSTHVAHGGWSNLVIADACRAASACWALCMYPPACFWGALVVLSVTAACAMAAAGAAAAPARQQAARGQDHMWRLGVSLGRRVAPSTLARALTTRSGFVSIRPCNLPGVLAAGRLPGRSLLRPSRATAYRTAFAAACGRRATPPRVRAGKALMERRVSRLQKLCHDAGAPCS